MEQAEEIEAVTEAIRPLLAGRDPGTIGAVLADRVATWLAGHIGSEELRTDLLTMHVALIKQLIPINEKMIIDRVGRH